MAGPIAIDTPDYQRGVFNPQLLLAAVPAGRNSVTVGVPTNAETLVVATTGIPADDLVDVVGVETGLSYPGVSLPPQPRIVSTPTWMYDVSAATDSQVSVTFTSAPTATWYVYADAGTHLTVDASLVKNSVGAAYVVPSIPSPQAGDHPPNELTYHSAVFSAAGVMLPALLAGQRYRVFAAQLMLEAGTLVGYLGDSLSGEIFLIGGAGSPGQLSYPLTGLPLPATASINFFVATGAGTVAGMVVHTIENV